MAFEQNTMFGVQYARFVRSMPMICPSVVPTVVGFASIAVLFAIGVQWPALPLGILLLALVPQWDSCVFRLMDFTACALLIVTGLMGVLKAVAG
ncbi:MAG: hypothetical protein JWO31_2617 [Phycisphaerales bacterium]|nr:hypothetical protein [Phycisphaerales bacterium]